VQAFELKPRPLYRAEKPVRDEAYKRFIRSFPCIVCRGTRWIEAAHFGMHGISSKSSDLNTLPVCRQHHRTAPLSYHKLSPAKFALAHNLDIAGLTAEFNNLWESKQRRTA